MKPVLPTDKEIDELVAFLPLLYAGGITPIDRWAGGTTDQAGISTLSWPKYHPVVKEFYRVAAKKCWSDHEYLPNEAERMIHDEKVVNRASLVEIKTMLTFCVRGERFCEGHWAQ